MYFFMFPGQGAQYQNMCVDAINNFSYAKEIWEESSNAINLDLIKIVKEGPKELLALTENTQPLLLAASFTYATIINKEIGIKADIFAGHSLGEYSALVSSGRLKLSDAIKVVKKRGQAMQSAVPVGDGSMAAILGLDPNIIDSMCKNITKEGKGIAEIANYNGSAQTVISGSSDCINKAIGLLMEMGGKAIKLPVSAPFHCSLMVKAAEELDEYTKDLNIQNMDTFILPNINPVFTKDYKREMLIKQVVSGVRWTETIENIYSKGVKYIIDVGPSKTLSGISRKILEKNNDSSLKILAFDSSNGASIKDDIKNLKNSIYALTKV